MGIGTMLKANKAYRAQRDGKETEAIRLYEECFAEGLNDARYVLSYAVLILRDGQYQKAKDFLVKHQKAPGMTPEQRVNLIVDYAACCYRLGDVDKAVAKLEELHRKGSKSLIYQTLGYLYVEKYALERKPDFAALAAEAAQTAGMAPETEESAPETETSETTLPKKRNAGPELTPEEAWNAGVQKALAFNQEAVDYDDEDPVCLDNMGQMYYRVLGDKAQAKAWFDKAHAIKPEQIDTLYFLSRYDLDSGDRASALEKLKKAQAGRFSPLNYCSREQMLAEIAALEGGN